MRRPYFFELFVVANLALVALLAHASLPIVGSPVGHLLNFSVALAGQAVVGIVIRAAVALVRRDRTYLKEIRSIGWIVETLRMVVAGALVVLTYGWIKLVVPIYHPRLFDQELWDLDRVLFFGMAPTTFFLDVFGPEWFLRAVDWAYANIFFASAVVAYAFFLSHPDRKLRVGFANGNAVLWISAAWLYLLVPSVGPAFRFPDIWFAHSETLRTTQVMQAILMRNYQNVIRLASGTAIDEPVRIVFGVAAFPSMHVAFQTYVFLWMRRLWRPGQVLFGIFVFAIFLGSMITGWHYLVDSLAGLLMAYLCYRFCFPRVNAHPDSGPDDAGRRAVAANG